MDLHDKLLVMEKLASRWGALKTDVELVNILKTIELIPSWTREGDGPNDWSMQERLPGRMAKDLFTWQNTTLLRALAGEQEQKYFCPPAMRTLDWEAMLLDLGMKKELDNEGLLLIAADIQILNQQGRVDEAIAKGRIIMRYMLESDVAMGIDMPTARKLGKIVFVPVKKPMRFERGGLVEYETCVCSFNQTVTQSSGPLVFSVLPVLTEDVSLPQILSSSLGITITPQVEIVLKHLRNLTTCGETLDRWSFADCSVQHTFGHIFSFLSDHWKDVPAAVQRALCTANLVPVGHQLMTPSRMFFRLSQDLSPFMHEVPRAFGAHERFLTAVGVREVPSPQDYIKFLSDFATDSRGNILNPNEIRAAAAIVRAIVATPDLTSGQDAGSLGRTYVPAEDNTLVMASRCILNDDNWLRTRVGTDLSSIGVSMLHPSIEEPAATGMGIPRLSEVLIETLVPKASLEEVSSESIERLQRSLALSAVQKALVALVVASANSARGERIFGSSSTGQGSISGAGAGVGAGAAGLSIELQSIIGTVTLRNVRSLSTRLLFKDGRKSRKDQFSLTLQDSVSFYHHDKGTTAAGNGIIYINSEAIKAPITAELACALSLCRACGVSVALAPSMALLFTAAAADVPRLLLSLRVGTSSSQHASSVRGQPGELVSEEDSTLLELKPLRTFRVGEVVAYQCDNSGVVVGAAGAAGEGDGGDEHLEMRYGHILDVGTFGEGSLRWISVRTGPSSSSSPGVVSVLATSLYSFISARDVGAGAGLKSRASNPQAQSQFRLEHATADDLGDDGLEMSSKSTRSIAAPVTAVTIEPVGRSELLGAVSSLLSRAKVPVSLEQKEMMDRILELDAANKRLQNDLVQERQSLLEASNLQRRTQAAMKCQICLTNEVSHVLTPCGHTLCGPCSSQLPQQKCPYCRGRIQNAVKFFLQEVDDEAV